MQDFFQTFRQDFPPYLDKPMSQKDVPPLDLLVFALRELGLIKLRTGWFSLTQNGRAIKNLSQPLSLYEKLFVFYGHSYDWLSNTYYDDGFAIIQQALSFNLYILKKTAGNFIPQQQIAGVFNRAFLQQDALHPFIYLFLEEFCLTFGLVEKDEESFRQSKLFSQLFQWKI